MIEPVVALSRLKSQLQSRKCLSRGAASDVDAGKAPPRKKLKRSSCSSSSLSALSSPTNSESNREVDDDSQFLIENNSLQVVETVKEYSDQYYAKVRGALETLVGALTPIEHAKVPKNDIQPALMNTDLFSREADSISLLLSLLLEEDFYVRYYTLQLLTALLTSSPNRLQEAILTIPRISDRATTEKMQVLACNSSPLQSQALRLGSPKTRFIGRRQLFLHGMSSACSESQSNSTHSPDGTVSPFPISAPRSVQELSKDIESLVRRSTGFTTRRALFANIFMYSSYDSSSYLSALAFGDPSVTIEEVTPPVFASRALFPTEVPEGNGSGVVWDKQGHIVTKYHVIGNALSTNLGLREVVARVNILAEGVQKNFEGTLVGAGHAKDLAVLKVEASEDLLRPNVVGQSSSLKVGQQCLAIGNPNHTLTVGVISGLNQDIFGQAGVTINGGIQTDAAINPGNSGGTLLNSKGNSIGINTAIFTQTGCSSWFECGYNSRPDCKSTQCSLWSSYFTGSLKIALQQRLAYFLPQGDLQVRSKQN